MLLLELLFLATLSHILSNIAIVNFPLLFERAPPDRSPWLRSCLILVGSACLAHGISLDFSPGLKEEFLLFHLGCNIVDSFFADSPSFYEQLIWLAYLTPLLMAVSSACSVAAHLLLAAVQLVALGRLGQSPSRPVIACSGTSLSEDAIADFVDSHSFYLASGFFCLYLSIAVVLQYELLAPRSFATDCIASGSVLFYTCLYIGFRSKLVNAYACFVWLVIN